MNTRILMTFLARMIVAACPILTSSPVPADDVKAPPVTIQTGKPQDENLTFWLETSLNRVFPQTPPGSTKLNLLVPRNSKNSFQVCVRNDGEQVVQVSCNVHGADDLAPQVRFVGLTPVQHVALGTPLREIDGGGRFIPGLVPDVLWPKSTAEICPFESRSFWVTLTIPKETSTGERTFRVCLSLKDNDAKTVELPIRLTIAPLVLQPRSDFPVTHWWWPQSNWDYYKTEMFDENWWRITRTQMENMLAHGSDMVYVPMFSFAFPKIFEPRSDAHRARNGSGRISIRLVSREAIHGHVP